MIEVVALDLRDPTTVDALIALQRAAYAVEAELLAVPELPPMRETPAELAASGESFLGARQRRLAPLSLLGAVSWKRLADGTLDIHRLVVHPSAFRQGIATRLLDALPEAPRTVVATGAANAPARALYERRGFRLAGEPEVAGGLRIVEYERLSASPTRRGRA